MHRAIPFLFILFSIFFSFPAYALTLNYNYDLADTYATSASPTTNYGTSYWLGIQGSKYYPSGQVESYVKFNIAPVILSGLSSAYITLISQGTTNFTTPTTYVLAYNTSLNWSETNLTWNVIPTIDELQDNESVNFTQNNTITFDITEAVISALQQGLTEVSIRFKLHDATFNNGGIAYSRNYTDATKRPYMTLNYNDTSGEPCDDTTNYPLGTRCDPNDQSSRQYVTNTDNCHLTYASCAEGSSCSQYSPVMNVTNDPYANYTSCYYTTVKGLVIKCTNVCLNGFAVWSNCIDSGCKKCPEGEDGKIYIGSEEGYYTNTLYTNQSSMSVPSWTIACRNHTSGNLLYIIDQNGNQTTQLGILTQAGNQVSETPFDDTGTPIPAVPTTNSITTWGAQVNSAFGSPYITAVLSFITSMGISLFIFLKAKGKKFETFIIPFFVCLAGFAMPGVEFFPTWIFLVLVTFSGVMLFWKAKGS